MNYLQIVEMVFQILPALFSAISTIQTDTGKPWEQVVVDVVNHLTPGQPNAPALAPTASDVNPADQPINSLPIN